MDWMQGDEVKGGFPRTLRGAPCAFRDAFTHIARASPDVVFRGCLTGANKRNETESGEYDYLHGSILSEGRF